MAKRRNHIVQIVPCRSACCPRNNSRTLRSPTSLDVHQSRVRDEPNAPGREVALSPGVRTLTLPNEVALCEFRVLGTGDPDFHLLEPDVELAQPASGAPTSCIVKRGRSLRLLPADWGPASVRRADCSTLRPSLRLKKWRLNRGRSPAARRWVKRGAGLSSAPNMRVSSPVDPTFAGNWLAGWAAGSKCLTCTFLGSLP
jgi:hypothetical protein